MSDDPTKERDLAARTEWYAEAKAQTMESIPGFLAKLADFPHSYSSICYAVAAAGLGAMRAMDRSPRGGITGFQASAILWEIISEWRNSGRDVPMRLLDMGDMLYPQHEYRFRELSAETWKWLQDEARKRLANVMDAHPDVLAHWGDIAGGRVPFGYRVEAA